MCYFLLPDDIKFNMYFFGGECRNYAVQPCEILTAPLAIYLLAWA